jgi:hypothetical protein
LEQRKRLYAEICPISGIKEGEITVDIINQHLGNPNLDPNPNPKTYALTLNLNPNPKPLNEAAFKEAVTLATSNDNRFLRK